MLVQIGHAGAINMLGISRVLVAVETENTYPHPTLFTRGPVVVKQDHVLIINYVDADGKKAEQRLSCGTNVKMANDLKDSVLKQAKEIENVGATQALEEALEMPSVVIVTEQCYLLAEAINYIVINEDEEGRDDRQYMLDLPKKRKTKGKKKQTLAQKNKDIREYIQERKPFMVVINFEPKGASANGSSPMSKHNSNSEDGHAVHVKVMGLRRSMKVFRDIVKQMREQIPDERFLDTLVESFLTETEKEDELIDKMELR